jgi:hypothetical protein
MKIMHLEIVTAALSIVLAYIALRLFKGFLTSGPISSETSRTASVGSRLAALWRKSFVRLRSNADSTTNGVVRIRQLRRVSDHENGALAKAEPEDSLTAHVEARLERAFEQYSGGRISIATFRNLAQIEAASIREQIAEALNSWPGRLDPQCDNPGLDPDMADALRLADGCLNWADEMVQKLGEHSSAKELDGYTARRVQNA